MPIIKSAKKRARQSIVRRERNLITRRQVKDARKTMAAAKASGNKKKLAEATGALQSALDIAVKKNVMHRNKAARLLSRAVSGAPKTAAKTPVKKVVKKAPVKKPAAKKTASKKAPAKKPAVKKAPAKK